MLSLLVAILLAFGATTGAPSPAERTTGDTPELQNEWVRVWRLKQAPHEKTPAAQRLPHVTVYLTDARQRITGPDGKAENVTQNAGAVTYRGAGKYVEQNVSDRPVEEIVIELKPGATRSPRVALDPVALDPQYHTVPFENDRVRVLRTVLAPHVKSPQHEHPHYVVVYLTELHTTMELGDGRVVDNPRRAGEVAWRDALKHVTENIGEQTAVEIQVELK